MNSDHGETMENKNKRKILINKYYQLKTSFGVAGLFALSMGILFIISSSMLVWNNISIAKAMTHQMDLQKVQEDILQSIEMLAKYGNKKNLIFEAYKAIGDLKKNTDSLKESNELLRRSIAVNQYLMWINGILGVALIIAVFAIVLRRTHRVAGPMFLMKRYMNDIIQGRVPEIRVLRKDDEFKDVFETFVSMIETLHLNRLKRFQKSKTKSSKG
jgi:methyl-accepting chemotaxis protein